VLEGLVVRTLQQVEATQQPVRIVALSATLPNYRDVAQFLRVNEQKGLFFFDAAFRPVPLAQRFFGVKEKDPWRQKADMNDLAWQEVSRSVAQGDQCLVFVHSRNETLKVAQDLLGRVREAGLDWSAQHECESWDAEKAKLARSRNSDMKELFMNGLGTHHAGMLRPDRTLMERGFEKGLVKVLVCTATLAWGVNLPAHTVVIRGTQIYDSQKGGFVEMSMQDVMQ
jgi:replicative superfamily II helicase